MSYQPDPPFQIYWPEEPPPVYRADPTAPSYYADVPVRDFYPDDPVDDSRESVMETAIRTMPVFAPVAQHTSTVRGAVATKKQTVKKPLLQLVPGTAPGAKPRASQSASGWGPNPTTIDRRVTLIEIQHLIDMFLEADDSDGYTRGELTPEIEEIDHRMKIVRRRVRGTLLQRVTDWMRPDKS